MNNNFFKKIKWNSLNSGLKVFLGIILIIVGIAGLFLPIVQGILFIIAGLALIGAKPVLKKLKKLKDYLVDKFFK